MDVFLCDDAAAVSVCLPPHRPEPDQFGLQLLVQLVPLLPLVAVHPPELKRII